MDHKSIARQPESQKQTIGTKIDKLNQYTRMPAIPNFPRVRIAISSGLGRGNP
jgi:hypothetical protein